MCGIAGVFAYQRTAPQVAEAELLRIREAMVARGPDGAGLWMSADKRIGLAHRRLAIIDLSEAGAQPMATPDGRFQVVFNGEIYNYRELRSDLEAKGYRFRSTSDTEVLLHLFAERGREMVHVLRGMFAFAIWDDKNRRLFLARDPFGIKPLYYSDDGSTVRFASQVKALLKGGRIDAAPQPAGHVGFCLWGYVPEPFTLYKAIRSLPAGSTLWIDEQGRHEPVQYFSVTDECARAGERALQISSEEVRERLRAALLDSVRHHLIADVPVGVFLSSGLDSSTVTALASELGQGSLHTITLGFLEYKGSHDDETPLAARVAAHYGTAHQTKWVSRSDFDQHLDNLIEVMDQPSIDGVNSYFVSKVAAEAGMKVALSGLGGDELFGGYPSFGDVPRMVNALAFGQAIPGMGRAFRWVSAPILKHVTSPKYAGLLEYGGSYSGAYLLRRGLFMPWELPDIIDGEMVKEGWQELQPLIRLEETMRYIGTDRLRVSALELTWYMRNQLLRDADWAGMAHSLEIRTPLVDVELFRRLVLLMGTASPPTKLDMARVPANALPEEILERRKTGFSVPVREWLQQDDSSEGVERGLRGWALLVFAESWSTIPGNSCRGTQPNRMKLLVVGHSYVTAFAQSKYVAMKKLDRNLQIRIVIPPGIRHFSAKCAREVATGLKPEEVVSLRDMFGGSHMTYVLDPVRLALILREFCPDLIHIEEDPYSLIGVETVFIARIVCRQAKISFFIWDNLDRKPRFPLGFVKRVFSQYTLSRSSLVVCGNQEGQQLLHGPKNYRGRSLVLPQVGLNPEEYETGPCAELRKQLLGKYGEPLIGFLGRLIPEKGVILLLQALSLLQHLPWRLLIVGSGPLEEEIQKYWKTVLGDRVVSLNALPFESVPKYLRCLDIFVLPSYGTAYWKEQFGVTLAQAMMAGVACVGSSSGAIPEVLGPGGIIFQEHSIESLAKVLEGLILSKEERGRLGEKGREFAMQHYTNHVVGGSCLAAFRNVIEMGKT